jgi:release factor glutamine methyltransferase
LIPRPETEQLVEAAIHWARPRQPLRVADIGTGSGCIAVILALHLPESHIDAVDISADALAVAQQNAQRHVPGRIHFHLGHLLRPLLHQPDLITANLPYVADGEWTMLDDGVKLYEPAVALRGGPDGLDLIRQLLQQATSRLNPGGAIFLEVGWRQGPAAQRLAQAYFATAQIDLMADYAGHDRIVAIKRG